MGYSTDINNANKKYSKDGAATDIVTLFRGRNKIHFLFKCKYIYILIAHIRDAGKKEIYSLVYFLRNDQV